LGIGDWGLGPIPNPQSPIPNPQTPTILSYQNFIKIIDKKKIIISFYKQKIILVKYRISNLIGILSKNIIKKGKILFTILIIIIIFNIKNSF